VEDVSPEINYRVSVFDHNTKLSESETTLIAFDHSESTGFGKLHPVSDSQGSGGFGDPVGSSVTCEELLEGEIYVNEKLANEIDAEQGDELEVFYGENLSRTFTVKAVVESQGRGAYEDRQTSTGNNIFMSLESGQELLGQQGKINLLKISNKGDDRDGMEHSDAVEKGLEDHLSSGMPILLLSKVKQDNVESAETSSEGMQDIFVMLGSFSIIAGLMLIVNIFVMLAEERKQEMGMSRAVGMSRKQLMNMFLFEGSAYSMMSAVVGTFSGVIVAFLVIAAIGTIDSGSGGEGRGPFGETSGSMEYFTFSMDSLLVALAGGMLITLLTITLASRKVSRLNIIRAIRGIPEPRYERHEITMKEAGTGNGDLLTRIQDVKTFLHDSIMRQYEIIAMGFGA